MSLGNPFINEEVKKIIHYLAASEKNDAQIYVRTRLLGSVVRATATSGLVTVEADYQKDINGSVTLVLRNVTISNGDITTFAPYSRLQVIPNSP
jgi:hypothetical protein